MLIASSLMLLMLGQSTASQARQSAPVLQVGIFSYGPDGGPQAAAYATSLDGESFQYAAGCEIGGGNRPVPDRATDAWRVSGAVERITHEEAVVRVDWQRVRAAGVKVTSPGGSVELTLHSGDRVLLDSVTPEPAAGCGGRTIGFEARYAPRPAWIRGPGGSLSESPAVTIMRSGGGGGGTTGRSGSGGGYGAGAGAGAGGGPVSISGTGGARSGGGSPAARGGAGAAGAAAKGRTAELFLVRADKSRPENPDFNMQGLILQVGSDVTEFAFSPFAVDTPGGPMNIRIAGTLRIATEDGLPQLAFTTTRSIQYSPSNSNGEATGTVKGSSSTKNPMPGPDDVLSFEMPPIRVPNSSATLPDQYSVRLRIR